MNEDERKSDPMIRDKKSLPLSGSQALPSFLFHILVIFPCIICLIPVLVVSVIISKVSQSNSGSKKVDSSQGTINTVPIVPVDKRPYDVVVFGSTGFTGKLAAKYIAKTYGGSSFRWAIAGRRKSALEELKKELMALNSALRPEHIGVVLADSTDYASLSKMVADTKVVITTAGPFDKYGSDLVKCCAENGTHYCDITGETDWVRKMIDLYDDKARETGARIVHFCGHDCVPWDLAVLECSSLLRKQGQNIAEVHCYDEIRADASGGTFATIFHSLGQRVQYKSLLGFDPLLKTTTGDFCDEKGKSTASFVSKNQSSLGYSKEFKHWVGPFVMAMVMANCVRRSFALNKYSAKLVYREHVVYPSFMAGVVQLIGMMLIGMAIMIPPLKWLFLSTGLIPKPGEGPSEESMDRGFLKVTAIATGDKNGTAKVQFYFPTDPGYRDTARMLVESGLVLALQLSQVPVPGGVYTPAACQGRLLTDRLLASGSSLKVN